MDPNPKATPKNAREHNKMLCESSQRLLVREIHLAKDIRKLDAAEVAAWKSNPKISEAAKKTVGDLYEAKVGQADKKNQNERIYPKEVWRSEIARQVPQLDSGHLIGAMDHQGYFAGGNFGDTCVVWRDLAMDENTGEVTGKFDVVGTRAGDDLQAMLDKKIAVGFSTYGYGTGHEPGDAERQRYGLGADEDACIMDGNYTLQKIDCVDDPSVGDARIRYVNSSGDSTQRDNPASEGRTNPGNTQEQNVEIETLEQLQAKAPKAHAAHIAALAATRLEMQQHKDAAKKLADAINPLLPALKDNALINLPQREVAPAEFQQAKTVLEGQVAGLTADKTALTSQLAEAKAKLVALEAQVAATDRVAKVMAKASPILKDNAYKASLREELEAKAKSDATFDESKVEAEIDRLCVKFDKISGRKDKGKAEAGTATRPALGQQGVDVQEDEIDDEERETEESRPIDDDKGPAAELVSAFGKPRAKEAK